MALPNLRNNYYCSNSLMTIIIGNIKCARKHQSMYMISISIIYTFVYNWLRSTRVSAIERQTKRNNKKQKHLQIVWKSVKKKKKRR